MYYNYVCLMLEKVCVFFTEALFLSYCVFWSMCQDLLHLQHSKRYVGPTCTPRMPKMMKKVQQMRTMLPMGRNDDNNVCTTSFRPGALLITL